jgi:hypothetical protein
MKYIGESKVHFENCDGRNGISVKNTDTTGFVPIIDNRFGIIDNNGIGCSVLVFQGFTWNKVCFIVNVMCV